MNDHFAPKAGPPQMWSKAELVSAPVAEQGLVVGIGKDDREDSDEAFSGRTDGSSVSPCLTFAELLWRADARV